MLDSYENTLHQALDQFSNIHKAPRIYTHVDSNEVGLATLNRILDEKDSLKQENAIYGYASCRIEDNNNVERKISLV